VANFFKKKTMDWDLKTLEDTTTRPINIDIGWHKKKNYNILIGSSIVPISSQLINHTNIIFNMENFKKTYQNLGKNSRSPKKLSLSLSLYACLLRNTCIIACHCFFLFSLTLFVWAASKPRDRIKHINKHWIHQISCYFVTNQEQTIISCELERERERERDLGSSHSHF
jgi:hypothetical protein